MVVLLWVLSAVAGSWPVADDAPAGPWPVTDSGVQWLDTVVGTGQLAEDGARLQVHYSGMLGDGTVFDSSTSRGESFAFRIGDHQVIGGWEDGAVGMRVGGTRRLIIPPERGYGSSQAGPIPPGSTLFFEISLVAVEGPRVAPSTPRSSDPDGFRRSRSGLRWVDLVVGAGDRPRPGKRVCVDYTAWHQGKLVADTLHTDRCWWLRYRHDSILKGLEEGLRTMRVGGIRHLLVPPELAYGRSARDGIPVDATLLFEVSLIAAD